MDLDYQPARELTSALVGVAHSGIVLREPSLPASLSNERDVAEAADRFIAFAIKHAPGLAQFAKVETLIDLMHEGRAAPSTDPDFFDDGEPGQPPAGAPELPDPKTELIPALLAAAKRWDEARGALADGERRAPGGEGSRDYRRFVRQLVRCLHVHLQPWGPAAFATGLWSQTSLTSEGEMASR